MNNKYKHIHIIIESALPEFGDYSYPVAAYLDEVKAKIEQAKLNKMRNEVYYTIKTLEISK